MNSLQICVTRPNNSFKPNLLRYGKGMAEKACHTFASTTQVGLTQALAPAVDRSQSVRLVYGSCRLNLR